MIAKKVNKIVGLKIEDFEAFRASSQIQAQTAKLIPVYKAGDEMALTSIFLSSLRLIKEFRDFIFRDLKLSRSGRIYYLTEVCIPDISPLRIDGLIIVVSKGVISDAAFFEMKNKNIKISDEQILSYLEIAKTLKINKLVTVSNEFVTDPSQSPLNIKVPKSIQLSHFSWTYLITKAQILLFKNDTNIDDDDQVEIMKEVMWYLESPVSGVRGYTQMKAGWKDVVDNIRVAKKMSQNDESVQDAVLSWKEEESDLALLLSRKLGVLVKIRQRDLKSDIKKLIDQQHLASSFQVKDSVSEIKLRAEFPSRIVSLSVNVDAPTDRGSSAIVTWIIKQLDICRKKTEEIFSKLEANIWVEADIRYVRDHIKVKLSEIASLQQEVKTKDVQSFNIVLTNELGANFGSSKKFVETIETMMLTYYEGIVQHLNNWIPKAPKLSEE